MDAIKTPLSSRYEMYAILEQDESKEDQVTLSSSEKCGMAILPPNSSIKTSKKERKSRKTALELETSSSTLKDLVEDAITKTFSPVFKRMIDRFEIKMKTKKFKFKPDAKGNVNALKAKRVWSQHFKENFGKVGSAYSKIGTWCLPDDGKYERHLNGKIFTGHATCFDEDGSKYTGSLTNGKKNGKGLLRSFNNVIEIGDFEDNSPKGEMTVIYPN